MIEKPKANLLLIRDNFSDKSIIGKLYLNGEFYGHTLELPWQSNKKSVSCIPKGVYEVAKRFTDKSKYKYEHPARAAKGQVEADKRKAKTYADYYAFLVDIAVNYPWLKDVSAVRAYEILGIEMEY